MQKITARSIKNYPALIKMLAEIIFDNLLVKSIREAEVVVGICDLGTILAQNVADQINSYDGRNAEACRVGITEIDEGGFFFEGSFAYRTGKQLLTVTASGPSLNNKKVVFVYLDFSASTSELEERRRLEVVKRFNEKADEIEEFINHFGGKLLESIVLPLPKDKIKEFLNRNEEREVV
jgi:hypothetical protein